MTPAVTATVAVTPTVDRLAEPTLPAVPNQADLGARVYWLSCLPCHGDRGQGLTDEFRQLYPPDHQYCWNSGCHGARPYVNGFTLPKTIPALIGPGAMDKFTTAAALESYVAAAMPFWKPGSLSESDSWQVSAYLLRANGLWDGKTDLGPANAANVSIGTGNAGATPEAAAEGAARLADQQNVEGAAIIALLAILLVLSIGFLVRRRRRD